MDATQSNRLARGLFAAAQGLSQDVQLRITMAQQAFQEHLAAVQQQDRRDAMLGAQADRAQAEKDRQQAEQDRAYDRQATLAQRQSEAQWRHEDAQQREQDRMDIASQERATRLQIAADARDRVLERAKELGFGKTTAAIKAINAAGTAMAAEQRKYDAFSKEFAKLSADPAPSAEDQQRMAQLRSQMRVSQQNLDTLTTQVRNVTQSTLAQFPGGAVATPKAAAPGKSPAQVSSDEFNAQSRVYFNGKWYLPDSPSLPKGMKVTRLPAGSPPPTTFSNGMMLTKPSNLPAASAAMQQQPDVPLGQLPDGSD